jgi:hypothetical protein
MMPQPSAPMQRGNRREADESDKSRRDPSALRASGRRWRRRNERQ